MMRRRRSRRAPSSRSAPGHDNTKANPNNPDPDQWVGYGDRTVDEMAHAWMNVVYLSDAGKAHVDAKKARQTNEAPQQ